MYHELRKRGTSAADLKFLQQSRRGSFRNFKSKSGTRIINLLVPLCFRSSCQRVPQCITNFGSGALDLKARVSPLIGPFFVALVPYLPDIGGARGERRCPVRRRTDSGPMRATIRSQRSRRCSFSISD